MPKSKSLPAVATSPRLQPVLIREVVIKAIRQFFGDQGFHEVITPVLNTALPLEPTIYAFATDWQTHQGSQQLYLTTSPESGLKKMLAMGLGNCYSIGKSFRNLESSGQKHQPEFLMLEWYREKAEYQQVMTDVQQLILFVKKQVDAFLQRDNTDQLEYQETIFQLEKAWPVFSLEKLLKAHAGLDLAKVQTDQQLRQFAANKGYQTDGATWEQLFNQLVLNEVEPHLPAMAYFLVDFPARISPLCQTQTDRPHLAERFEVFFGNLELGNGNTELVDADQVSQHFQQQLDERHQAGEVAHAIDTEFIHSLKNLPHPPYAGIGLGVDRLVMLMADVTEINQVEVLGVS
jgi:elongation factor P--beta-lysine ligase